MRRSLDASGDDSVAYESDCAYRGVDRPGLFVNRFFNCVSWVGISEIGPIQPGEPFDVSGVRSRCCSSGDGSSRLRRAGRGAEAA